MIFLQLFWEFFKTGLFAVGGGMATVPFLSEMAERTGWFTREMLADMIAVGESTPGPIGVNTATYVGYTVAGIPGGIIATLGLVMPAFLMTLVISSFLKAFRTNRYVERVFYGIRPASVGMIAAACVALMRLCFVDTAAYAAGGRVSALFNWKGIVLFAVIWVASNFIEAIKKLHPIVLIACSAVIGIAFRFAGA